MNTNIDLKDILINMHKRYNLLNDFMNLTKEMEKALAFNDDVSLKMLLNMRQDAMKAVDNIDILIKKLVRDLPRDASDKIHEIALTDNEIIDFESTDEKLIYETRVRTKELIKRIITINDVINKKVLVKK